MSFISKLLILAGPFSGLTESTTIVNFLLLIDSKIYELFGTLYKLYLELASARIFKISAFDYVVNNVYIIFGIVALFILAFFILQTIINPDGNGAKSAKEFITRFALAIFLTFLTPTLFDFLYDFQASILKWQAIPKITLSDARNTKVEVPIYYQNENGQYYCADGNSFYDPDNNPCELMTSIEIVDQGNAVLESDGYGIAYYVLNGFLYPTGNVEDSYDITVKASEYFNAETGIWATIGGCAIGALGVGVTAGVTAIVTYFTGGTATGILAPIVAHTGATAAAACLAIGTVGNVTNAIGETVTADNYSWNSAVKAMQFAGHYDELPAFDIAVVDGRLTYTPIISTVAGLILVYLIFSFCLDLGIRAGKLVIYQVVAPLSFIISSLPSKKDLMNKWFKAVITTWLEVFIRVICVCSTAMLIRNLNVEEIGNLSGIAQAIIVLGLVALAKQVPKLLGDVLGFDSGSLKLGIREKLAEGGAFTAGAILGGAATALARNSVNGAKNVANKFEKGKDGKIHLKEGVRKRDVFGSALSGIGSMAAGTISGGFRSGKAGWGAKSFKDMKNSAGSGAQAAVSARDKRAAYKASHPGFLGATGGHIEDAFRGVGEWAGVGVVSQEEASYFENAANAFDGVHSKMESTYKGKPEHNRIKEKITELNQEKETISYNISRLEALGDLITKDQEKELNNYRNQLQKTINDLEATTAFKSKHEAKEMAKKMAVQMVAMQDLINAKTKYFDISASIFTDNMYGYLKDAEGKTLADGSEHVKKLVEKIKTSGTLSIEDFQDEKGNAIFDMNSLEKFTDQVGIAAKNASAAKQVEVSRAKALKESKKQDK